MQGSPLVQTPQGSGSQPLVADHPWSSRVWTTGRHPGRFSVVRESGSQRKQTYGIPGLPCESQGWTVPLGNALVTGMVKWSLKSKFFFHLNTSGFSRFPRVWITNSGLCLSSVWMNRQSLQPLAPSGQVQVHPCGQGSRGSSPGRVGTECVCCFTVPLPELFLAA